MHFIGSHAAHFFTLLTLSVSNLIAIAFLYQKAKRLERINTLNHRIIATVAPLIGYARLMQEEDFEHWTPEQRARMRTIFNSQAATFHDALGLDVALRHEAVRVASQTARREVEA